MTTLTPAAWLRGLLPLGCVAALTAPMLGCGAKVSVEGGGGLGAGAATGDGAGSISGGGSSEGVCTGPHTVTGDEQLVKECFVSPTPVCPDQYQAIKYIVPGVCMYVKLINCGPVVEDDACCYMVIEYAKPC